jgi:hypothetical protein
MNYAAEYPSGISAGTNFARRAIRAIEIQNIGAPHPLKKDDRNPVGPSPAPFNKEIHSPFRSLGTTVFSAG